MDYEQVIGQFVGEQKLFKRIHKIALEHNEPKIFAYGWVANLSMIQLPRQELVGMLGSGGAGYSEQQSLYSAMGEALERYCALEYTLKYSHSQQKFCCWNELKDLEIPTPESYLLFSQQQYNTPKFPYRPWDRDSKVNWFPVVSSHQKLSFVPSAFVLYPYLRPNKKIEPPLAPCISTGLALGASEEQANLYSLYETLERDAIALAWNWNLPVTELHNDAFFTELKQRVSLADNYHIFAYSVNRDIDIPSVMVFLVWEYEKGKYYTSLGSACRLFLHEALEKAFLEAIVIMMTARRKIKMMREPILKDFSIIRSFEYRAVFYCFYPDLIEDRWQRKQFLCVKDKQKIATIPKTLTVGEEYKKVKEILHHSGYQAFVADLTIEALREHGFYVRRTIVPRTLGLEGDHNYRYQSTQRIEKLAKEYNFSFSENALPHPLA